MNKDQLDIVHNALQVATDEIYRQWNYVILLQYEQKNGGNFVVVAHKAPASLDVWFSDDMLSEMNGEKLWRAVHSAAVFAAGQMLLKWRINQGPVKSMKWFRREARKWLSA